MWVKLPIPKSAAASNRISNSKNCNLITHLTPATFIIDNKITAAHAKPLCAPAVSKPNNPAIDSPNPNTFNAHPTAYLS